jgi:uncharacterized protein YndB with AHSA1/START domain
MAPPEDRVPAWKSDRRLTGDQLFGHEEAAMMRWVLIVAALVVGVAVLFLVVGLLRPSRHVASTRATYAQPPDVVWATLSDFARWAEWNPEVKSVERLPDRNGHAMLNVVGSWGAAPTELLVVEPPVRLHTAMDAGSFRGGWRYELAPAPGGGTLLTVTEEGEVLNPVFRAFMIFHDNHATMMAFHHALARRLGGSVEPVKVG